MRIAGGEVWRATRTPDGPATLRLRVISGSLRADAWGPGAARALDGAAALAGELDDDDGFRPAAARWRRCGRASAACASPAPATCSSRWWPPWSSSG